MSLAADFEAIRLAALKPRPRLKVWQWADANRVLANGASATPGRWRTAAQPVSFGPFDAATEPDTNTITLMAATQVVKSEFLINVALYFAHQDPCGVLFVQPNQALAEAFSKERIELSLAKSPSLCDLFDARKSTMTHKQYPGGAIDFVGAHSPTDISSRPKRVVLCDEIDKYPPSAGKEGSPLGLAEERSSSFTFNRLNVRVCSPTVTGKSLIEREFLAGDQRRCYVPCPHCVDAAPLTWARVVFSKDEHDQIDETTAAIRCDECGAVWSEVERIQALRALEHEPGFGWRQTKKFTCCDIEQVPEVWTENGRRVCVECGERVPYAGHASFHVSKIYSIRHPLSALVKFFVDCRHDPAKWQLFYNTQLAETWEETGVKPLATVEALIERREAYGPEDLPDEVKLITAGTDVQGNRIETQIIGWGADEEAFALAYVVIYGDPSIVKGEEGDPSVWEQHDKLLASTFTTRSGRVLRIRATCVDTQGSFPDVVLRYCTARRAKRVFGTKGANGPRAIFPQKVSRFANNQTGYVIGVDSAKEIIFRRLEMPPATIPDLADEEDAAAIPLRSRPGYIHFPLTEDFEQDYFDGLLSEEKFTRKRLGLSYTVWVKQPGKRNEPLDTFVLAFAARKSLPSRLGSTSSAQNVHPAGTGVDRIAPRSTADPVEAATEAAAVAGPPLSRPGVLRQRGAGFLSRGGGSSWLRSRSRN